MRVEYNTKQFMKDMNNVINYSFGFLDGAKAGKRVFLDNLGKATIEVMKQYIDSMARVDPAMLQHVYEWEQSGSPNARLFDIDYTVSNLGLSVKSSFRQSNAVQSGSKTPFYDKARIMENGIPVTIRPVRAKALVFEENGEQIFTKQPVTVRNPGGDAARGGFQRAFDSFMNQYFTQAFLNSSGIINYLKNPVVYSKNLQAGKRMGKSKGYETGYRWIVNAGVIN